MPLSPVSVKFVRPFVRNEAWSSDLVAFRCCSTVEMVTGVILLVRFRLDQEERIHAKLYACAITIDRHAASSEMAAALFLHRAALSSKLLKVRTNERSLVVILSAASFLDFCVSELCAGSKISCKPDSGTS